MPILLLTPVALSVLPLLVQCAPWDLQQRDLVITETLTSTFQETATMTSFTAVLSTSSPSTDVSTSPSTVSSSSADVSSPASTAGPEAILFFPPGALPDAIAAPATAAAPPSSSSQSSSSVQPAPSPVKEAGATPKPQVMAYYPDWAASTFPPEKIDYARFDWIDFAFAVPDQNFNLAWDGSKDAPDLLSRLVAAAHQGGKKVKLSVGGWTGSKFFSSAVSDSQNRQVLAGNILALYKQFQLDGIDIDWEYPGQDGNDGNIGSSNDTSNFLSFLQLLRSTLPPDSKITAAVQTVPFADENGAPMEDVSAFAKVLDWVLVMNYDTWGSSPTPGPNAPLSDACRNATQRRASAAAALDAWTSAGFPASQLVLGVPSYGYLSRSNATTLRARSRHRRSRHSVRRHSLYRWPETLVSGIEADADPQSDTVPAAVVATNEDGGTDDGQVQFRELVGQGVLQYAADGDGDNTTASAPTSMVVSGQEIKSLYAGRNGFTRFWDNCSSTPFLRSAAAEQVVSYDDPLSLGMKAAFVREAGMLGVNMFDVHGDTDQWDLTDALRKGLGLLT
ncbi:hypothetical protein AcV5_000700 [Taiwanofungus camphoratus]|nr:hypothetical protein AcV5_000700 [Antrodia cinnamomea]